MSILSDKEQKEILESIEKYGSVEEPVFNINSNTDNDVLSRSSGMPRIQRTCERKAFLIGAKPKELGILTAPQIRCCLCHKIISYPAWYYRIAYAVTKIHYFICFDSKFPNHPTAKCYRRSV